MIHELSCTIAEIPHKLVSAAAGVVASVRKDGKRVFFIGNGGSCAIAGHMAADWLKNGNIKATSFGEPPLITCMANDYGYHQVYSRPLGLMAEADDLLVAISSSGESLNILGAVVAGRERSMRIMTLTGFSPTNHMRELGTINFHVPSHNYGVVETTHLAILHAILEEANKLVDH